MRTAYLGTSEFAAEVLARLALSPHRPVLVVTRPDRRRGRGRKLAPPPVAEAAGRLGIATFQPEDVNDDESRGRIAALEPEALAICAYGALIKDPLLSEHEFVNVHPSLLPRWRGAAPVERAIEAGDEETGVTIMRLAAELDAGPIGLQRGEPIRSGDDYGSLAARLAGLAGELLVEALDDPPPWREQSDQGVSYAEKIAPGDRRLDPSRPAQELERRVRALTPHVGTFLELPSGERLGIRRAGLAAEGADLEEGALAARDDRLLLGTCSGALELIEVQPPGGRPMDAGAYLRGRGATILG
jgi:methionyl-tRNA formyltransferase